MREPTAREATTFAENEARYSLWQLVLYFLWLGTFGFGGPVALVGYMHRDLVERPGLAAFVEGVTAAAIGAITGAVLVIAQRSITDVPTTLIALATVALPWNPMRMYLAMTHNIANPAQCYYVRTDP